MVEHLNEMERDLLAKAKAATPGPWHVEGTPNEPWRRIKPDGDGCIDVYMRRCVNGDADAAFIASANPAAIISLLASLAEAREVIAKLPKTTDGVPIVPLMRVWSKTPKEHTVTWIHDCLVKAVCECHDEELVVAPKFQPVYSTREAALAARSPATAEGEHNG